MAYDTSRIEYATSTSISERAAELYKLISGKTLPILDENFVISPRTREHARRLCDSIEAQRKHVPNYHP